MVTITVASLAAAWIGTAAAPASAATLTAGVKAAAKDKASEPRAANRKAARRRAAIRRRLARQVKRDPGVVLRRRFARKAALVDFKLPLTLRLNRPVAGGGFEASDDQIEITYDDSVIPWPLAGDGGTTPAPQTTNLSGSFTMESSFADDSSGYGELGAMETIIGGGIEMTATPFTISEFALPCGHPQLSADPGGTIAVTSAGPKFGLMNMFSGATRGSLALRMTFASERYPSCGGVAELTPMVDNSAAPPMPVRFSGEFRVSPAISGDGRMRVGVLEIDDAVTPQLSTFAYVRSCTGTITCDPMQFPARLKLKKLTAEVLLGDAMP